MPQLGFKINSIILLKDSLRGYVKPVYKSLSLFPPDAVSTVKAKVSKLAALALSSILRFKPSSL